VELKLFLKEVCLRFVLPLPLILNHFILKVINKYPFGKNIRIAVEFSLLGVALVFGLPCSIAMFNKILRLEHIK